jgi:predicted aldo/keto reductase-like oxidoreductase
LVKREVSPQAAMMICKASDAEKSGLRYEARYVLTQDQVDGLARGAGRLMGAL